MRLRSALQMPEEGARAAHYAPEVNVHEPRHLRLIEFVELTEQCDSRVVEEQVERWKICDRGCREILNLLRLGNIDGTNRDAAGMSRSKFLRHRLEAGAI